MILRPCLLVLLLSVSEIAIAEDLLPRLVTPGEIVGRGKPWMVVHELVNVGSQELFVRFSPTRDEFGAGHTLVLDSQGRNLFKGSEYDIEAARPEFYKLLEPGEKAVLFVPFHDEDFGMGSQEPDLVDVDSIMRLGTLSLPSGVYRIRWRHKEIENPFAGAQDRAKVWIGEVWSNTLVIQTTEREPVKVGLDVDPDTLNFKSEGKWITAYLSTSTKLDFLTSTTKFMGTVASDKIEWEQVASGEWRAGIKFPRSLVIDLLKDIRGWELDGYMKVFVSAESGAKMFWGDDKIRILEDPGAAPPAPPPAQPPGNKPSTPPGQDKKKSPRR